MFAECAILQVINSDWMMILLQLKKHIQLSFFRSLTDKERKPQSKLLCLKSYII
nr:MAG TPA: hypothetical protein [Caudoviricetes sp.]